MKYPSIPILAIFGESTLGLSFIISILQIFFKRRPVAIASFQFICLLFSFLVLIISHVFDEFKLASVFKYSHTNKPIIYKISGVWSFYEGSLLLWVLFLSFFNLLLSFKKCAIISSIFGFLISPFILFLIIDADPFILTGINVDNGCDLNPILQDKNLLFHPPILYLGLTSTSVLFVLGIKILLEKRFIIKEEANFIKKWSLISWLFLTIGISLGSFWSSYEIGLGNIWFWDPIEIVSLILWVLLLILIHLLRLIELNTQLIKGLSYIILSLSILIFNVSLLILFVVRSGLVFTIHGFFEESSRVQYFNILLLIVFLISLLIVLHKKSKYPKIFNHKILLNFLNRDFLINISLLIFFYSILALLFSLIYPAILSFKKGIIASLNWLYFHIFIHSLIIPAFLIISIIPYTSWNIRISNKHSRFISTMNLTSWCIFLLNLNSYFISKIHCSLFSYIIIFLGIYNIILWIILFFFSRKPLFSLGSLFNHVGFIIMILGIVVSNQFETTHNLNLKLGESIIIEEYKLSLFSITNISSNNYDSKSLTLVVSKDRNKSILNIEERFYWTKGIYRYKSDYSFLKLNQLYATLGEKALKNNYWNIIIKFKPYSIFIWIGIIFMIFGSILLINRNNKKES